jgi:hypothetical protein
MGGGNPRLLVNTPLFLALLVGEQVEESIEFPSGTSVSCFVKVRESLYFKPLTGMDVARMSEYISVP